MRDRRGKDDEISRRMWKVVETKAEEVGLVETKEKREKGKRKKEIRRKEAEERKKKKEEME